jgi:hypothetical protein
VNKHFIVAIVGALLGLALLLERKPVVDSKANHYHQAWAHPFREID